MRVKYYFVFFVIFCVVCGGGFYVLSNEIVTLPIAQTPISLHVGIWMVVILTIFFFFTLIFFSSNWISKFWSSYRNDRDYDHFINQIHAQILQHPIPHHTFNTSSFQTLSNILSRINLEANLTSPESQNHKIDALFTELQKLQKGEVIKLDLEKDSELWCKNITNKLKANPKFASKILDEDYPTTIKKRAIDELVENNLVDEKLIHKFLSSQSHSELSKHFLYALLQKGYQLGSKELLGLLELLQVDSKEFFHIAKKLKAQVDPDTCIDLFATLASQKDEAKEAYVFILLDYSMVEKAQDFLNDHDDLILPRAFIELKKMGKNYPLEKFFE